MVCTVITNLILKLIVISFIVITISNSLETAQVRKIKKVSEKEKTIDYWKLEGRDDLKRAMNKKPSTNRAKNVILFIGDGMSLSTITASRHYKNQMDYKNKEPDTNLYFENLPYTGLMKTHAVNLIVSDSATTASAILSGVKSNSRTIGMSPRIPVYGCQKYIKGKDDLVNIANMFKDQGRSVGVATTTRLTHPTPAAVYAHIPFRSWEASVPHYCRNHMKDAGQQFIEQADKLNVMLSGGRRSLSPNYRKDGKDLLKQWKRKMKNKSAKYISTRGELLNNNFNNIEFLLGLFSDTHLSYVENRTKDEPSLYEMASTAVNVLKKNPKGYFLLVEGGRIDHAHHASLAQRALDETLEFDNTIQKIIAEINLNETLVIVTADHSHVFTIGSYSYRENDITQINKKLEGLELDKKPHTTLLYSNGPGYKLPRPNISNIILGKDYIYQSGVPLDEETHNGEDVAAYGIGPWAHLLTGSHHQTYIGHLMMHASCTGDYVAESHCVSAANNLYMKNQFLIIILTSILLLIRML